MSLCVLRTQGGTPVVRPVLAVGNRTEAPRKDETEAFPAVQAILQVHGRHVYVPKPARADHILDLNLSSETTVHCTAACGRRKHVGPGRGVSERHTVRAGVSVMVRADFGPTYRVGFHQ